MPTNRQDVELRIRARDTSKADLRDLIKTLKDLRAAQTEQLDAAKAGTATMNELERSYRNLENVGKALLSQQGLITTWRNQSAALAEARERTQAAQQSLQQYQQELATVTSRTKEQNAELRLRTRELTAAEKAESRYETAISKTADKLERAGIGLDRLDQDQRRIREAISRTNDALAKQDTAIEGYDANLRRLRAAEQQKIQDAQRLEEELRQQEAAVASLARAEQQRQANVSDVEQQRQATLERNRAREYTRWWDQALAEREARERDAAAKVQQYREEQARQAQREARDYQRFWEQALNQIEAKEAEAAQQDAQSRKLREQRQEMQRLADAALQTQRNYTSVATGLRSVTTAAAPAAQAVRNVLDPTGEALKSLDGLEAQVDSLAASISKIDGPVADLKGQMATLAAVQKNLGQQAQLIDAFNRQMLAVRAARQEYAEARGEVRQLAETMRTMDAPTAEVNAQMQQAQSRLRQASSAMQAQTGKARQLREELRQAGISTQNLSAQEERLVSTANRTRTAVDQLSSAHRRYGDAVDTGVSALARWGQGERTTLSLIQRIKGELLALTTTYIGLQGGITLAANAVDRYKQQQQLQQRLLVANKGSLEAVGDEMKYIQSIADRLGYSYLQLGQSYAKFSVAARATGLTQEEARFTFEGVIKAARAQNMSDEQTQAILYALEQMVSKGAVQAEELKQQLGDRLPGAIATFAEATGRTIPELTKAMENGAVSSREVIDFARQLAKDNDTALDAAINGVQAAEGRLTNAMDRFYIGLAEGGFIDKYTDMLNQLADLLQSEEGQQLAESLGDALQQVVDLIVLCIQNLDTVQTILSAIATGMAVKFFLNLAANIRSTTAAAGELIAMIKTLPALFARTGSASASMGTKISTAAALGARAIPLIGAALIAWDIGKIMYQQSDTFADAVDYVVLVYQKLSANAQKYIGSAVGAIQDLLTGAIRALGNWAADAVGSVANTLAGLLEHIPGSEDIAASLRGWSKDLTAENRDFWSEYNRQWAAGQKALDEADAAYQEKIRKRHKETQDELSDDTPSYPETRDPGAGVSKEERDAAALNAQLDKLQEKLDKQDMASRFRAERKNLDGLMKLVDEEFEPLRQQAASLEGDARIDAEVRIEKLIAQRKEEVRRDYNSRMESSQKSSDDKRVRAAEALANKLAELEAGLAVDEAKVDPNIPYYERLQAALNKVKQEYDKVYQQADKLEKLGGGEQAEAARDRLDTLRAQALEQAKMKSDQDELNRLQETMNARLQLRQTLLDTINKLQEGGLISQQEAVKRTDEVNSRMGELILKAQEAVRTFAEANQALMSPEAFQTLMAQLEGVKATIDGIGGAYTDLDKTIAQSIATNGVKAFDDMATAASNFLFQAGSISDVFQSAGQVVAQFFAQLLRDIALAIIRQSILNALVAMTGGSGYGGIGAAAKALGGVAHTGGVVGSSVNTSRSVPAGYFANAPRFHSGGLPGLQKGEVPIIAQEGEEVLTKDDPRNILNGGKTGNGSSQSSPERGISMVLVEDSRDLVSTMQTSAGDEVIFKYLKKNRKTVKSLLG